MEDPSDDKSLSVPELHGLTPEQEKSTERGLLHSFSIKPGAVWFVFVCIIFLIFPWQVCGDGVFNLTSEAVTDQCRTVWFSNIADLFGKIHVIGRTNIQVTFLFSCILAGIPALLYYFLLYKRRRPQ